MVYLFDIPAYFILLRETLEVTIILAVLLGFIDKLDTVNELSKKHFKRQLWIGAAAGLGISLLIGAIFVIVFYTIEKNFWEDSEDAWEGSFSLIASIVITLMSLSMIRVQQWRAKWESKLKAATDEYLVKHERGNKWALILLPLTVVCREGVETFVFIAGIGFNKPATGLPIPVITGMLTGFAIGYFIYKGSHKVSLKLFFIITTVFLLFVAAGLFSNSVHSFQLATGTNEQVVWQLKCCDPEESQFWAVSETLFGWRNVATVGTTVSYFLYWIVVGLLFFLIQYREKKIAARLEHNDQSSFNDTTNEKDEINEKDEQIATMI